LWIIRQKNPGKKIFLFFVAIIIFIVRYFTVAVLTKKIDIYFYEKRIRIGEVEFTFSYLELLLPSCSFMISSNFLLQNLKLKNKKFSRWLFFQLFLDKCVNFLLYLLFTRTRYKLLPPYSNIFFFIFFLKLLFFSRKFLINSLNIHKNIFFSLLSSFDNDYQKN